MRFIVTLSAVLFCTLLLHENTSAQEIKDSVLQKATDSISQKNNIEVPVADRPLSDAAKSYFSFGASYTNNNVYLGRKDSVAVPYLSPKIGYYTKSGFFIEAAGGFIASGSNSRLDLFSFGGGYSFKKGNYDGAFTASKFYYNSQSTSVKSEVKGSVEYFNGYNMGFIKPTLLATLNFGNKTDFAGAFGLEHTFSLLGDMLEITPTAVANASTQNYYNSYYKQRKYSIARKGRLPPAGVSSISGEVLDAAAFKVLDYELSLPVNFETGKWTFILTPVYAIPVHPAEVIVTTTLNNGTSASIQAFEKIQNNFYIFTNVDRSGRCIQYAIFHFNTLFQKYF